MAKAPNRTPSTWREDPAKVRPMLAMTTAGPTDADLENPALVYEPKYDGIRALVALEPGQPSPYVHIWSRNGNEKTAQFPEVVRGLKDFAKRLRAPVLLDGEIVALDPRGEPAGFQRLQGRMHLVGVKDIDRHAAVQGAAFIAFDMLRDGVEDLRPLVLSDRRIRLERLFGTSGSSLVRHGEFSAGDGRRLHRRAQQHGWEGLVAKRADSIYESGRRTPAWRKLKILGEREFVIGGWTSPRASRRYFGALLLGAYEAPPTRRAAMRGDPHLVYVGHAGTGFTDKELARVHGLLQARATRESPFREAPPGNETPHWVKPELVAQVRYTEMTNDRVLRHPVYLGLRDDVDAASVTLEEPRAVVSEDEPVTAKTSVSRRGAAARAPAVTAKRGARTSRSKQSVGAARGSKRGLPRHPALEALVERLSELEDAKRDGQLTLPDGSLVEVTNLAKIFWPGEALTKGDLLRFYVQVSPWLLPAVADRPLVMKRFPNGVKGKAFYQQRAPDGPPAGVRVDSFEDEGEPDGIMPRLVGGSLQTLLYMTQLAAISQDPWFSKADTPDEADYAALDLDPMPGVPFRQVLDVARWLRDELATLDVPAVPKTSGSSGLHIYIPLPPGTPYGSGQLLCQILATLVSLKHPKVATVERTVAKRGRTVYVDYLQNIEGKTLATACSARASEFAGVSTPLTWDEVDASIAPEDFTVKTVLDRFAKVGDLWAPVLGGAPVDLHAVLERLSQQ